MSDDISRFLYSSQGKRSYSDVLEDVQEHMSNTYQELLATDLQTNEEVKLLKEYIQQYLTTRAIATDENQSVEALTERLYLDMVGFSFITHWLEQADEIGLEEIDINAWDNIDLIMEGQRIKVAEQFLSPQHAVDVVRRMLQVSDTVMDDAKPVALGSLAKNTRIAALKTPVLDEEIGVSASIRIVRSKMLSAETLVGHTATEEMLDFLAVAIRFGVSICLAGNTGSGKTSTVGWLLSTVPASKRIFTIEEGSREFDLIARNEAGETTNSVIHTITKPSQDPDSHIDQVTLLDYSLRFNPDIIVVGEMRSKEAFAAQEAARTGHTVVTTIHSKTAVGAYMRMTTLAKRAHDFSDETLIRLMIEAFPIIVYQRQLEDSSRKITEIIQGEYYEDGKVIYRTLFRFVVDDNAEVDGKAIVTGHFEKVSPISEALRQELLQNGAPKKDVERF